MRVESETQMALDQEREVKIKKILENSQETRISFWDHGL